MLALNEPGLSKLEFTNRYAEEAAARLPQVEIEVTGDLTLEVRSEEATLTLSLDNFWLDYETYPSEHLSTVEQFLASLTKSLEQVDSFGDELDTKAIVPVVRDSEYVRAMGYEPAAESLVGDLWVVYAEDNAHVMRFLDWEEIDAAKIDRGALRRTAMNNLLHRMPSIERHGSGPTFMMTAGGNYEASLLLFDPIWDQQEDVVEGHLVVAVPARDMLVFTGSESAEGLEELQRAIERFYAGTYPLSSSMFLRQEGRWVIR